MRRFINLIDTLYDNRIRVVISADVQLDRLFNFSDKPKDMADEHRILMDDLKITHGSVGLLLQNKQPLLFSTKKA